MREPGHEARDERGAPAASGAPDDSWPQVGVLATPDSSETIENWLLAAGALAVTFASAPVEGGARDARIDDDIERAVLEPAPGEVRLWDTLTVVGLFAQGETDADIAEALALSAAASLGARGLPEYRLSRLADTVWERVWMSDYGPMRFGPRFRVVPSYAELDDDGSVTLVLDPGLAFGSGTHATTAQCLEWLGRDTAHTLEPLAARRVIDYGCGSGVLAIAAALLGAERVHATDIDPQALLATRENAVANGVSERLTIVPPDALTPGTARAEEETVRADLLLANILLGPLETLADTFAGLLEPGGTLVLSGLLESQIEPLRLRYDDAFDFAPGRSRDGWALLVATRRPIA